MGDSISALNLEAGQLVGGYVLESRLGGGAMGSVWRVKDGAGTEFAMKILRDSLKEDGGADQDQVTARERLRREAAALSRVRHPGVTSIVDMELDDAVAFIVTELVEGKNLREDVDANGRYVGGDLERLAEKLISAVKAVHEAGIIHRDIKPTNVMVSVTGPVLVDFGIAMGEGESHMTRTGLVMGTPGFIAPEVIDGAESDDLTDWWSVASVLAFAATGRPVFGTKPMMAVLERAASGHADLTGLPPRTLAAFRSALAPDRARRCTPDELLEAIRSDAQGELGFVEMPGGVDAADGAVATQPPVPLPPAPPLPPSPGQGASAKPGESTQWEASHAAPQGAQDAGAANEVVRPFGAGCSNAAHDGAAVASSLTGAAVPVPSAPGGAVGAAVPGVLSAVAASEPKAAFVANPRLAWRDASSSPTVALPAAASPLAVPDLRPLGSPMASTASMLADDSSPATLAFRSAMTQTGTLPSASSLPAVPAVPAPAAFDDPAAAAPTVAVPAAPETMALETEPLAETTLPFAGNAAQAVQPTMPIPDGGTVAMPMRTAVMPTGIPGQGVDAAGQSVDDRDEFDGQSARPGNPRSVASSSAMSGDFDETDPAPTGEFLPPAILPPDEAPGPDGFDAGFHGDIDGEVEPAAHRDNQAGYSAYPNGYPSNGYPRAEGPVDPVRAAQRTQMKTARWLHAAIVPLALAAVPIVLMFTTVPVVAAILTGCFGWIMHVAGVAGRAQLQREERRGGVRKGRDRFMGIVGAPWYALRGLGHALPGVALGAVVFTLIMAAGMLVLRPQTASLSVPLGSVELRVPLPSGAPQDVGGWILAVAGLFGWLGMTYAPASDTLRMGLGMVWARRVVEDGAVGEVAEAIASQRTRTARLVAVTVAAVFAVATMTVLAVSGMIDWFPLGVVTA